MFSDQPESIKKIKMEELLLSSDFEKSLGNIEQYVKNILDLNDQNKKKALWFHFQKLINMLFLNEDTIKQPRKPDNVESQPKKLKLEPVLNRFPDEMWMKILTYLPVNDIFGSFALISKHFHNLTMDSAAIKYFHFKYNIKSELRSYEYRGETIQEPYFSHFDHYEDAVKVIARLRLIELKLENFRRERLVLEALKSSQRLKSIKVTNSYNDNRLASFSSSIKKYGKKLENVEFRSFRVDGQTMIEISKVKTLKSLTIHTKWIMTFSPQLFTTLAESENQLEEIDFQYISKTVTNRNEIRSNMNNLLKMKGQTMKFLGLVMNDGPCIDNCVSLESLSLCKNLTKFHGYLHPHDFGHFSELKNIETLILDCRHYSSSIDIIPLFNQMNLVKLKHLSFQKVWLTKEFMEAIGKFHFPVLERLYFHSNGSQPIFTEVNLRHIPKNIPNLKIIEFGKKCVGSKITNEFLLQILEDKDIFVQFENSKRQTNLENYLLQENAIEKYQQMKLNSLRWSEINLTKNE